VITPETELSGVIAAPPLRGTSFVAGTLFEGRSVP
jgi:hypothetical protein